MHMSRTIGRGVLWALTRVVRSQLKTFLILRRSGWQSLGTSLEHCLCTFSPQSARATGQKVRRAWPCCLQRDKKTVSKRLESQSVCVTKGISSGVKYTCRDRWVSVKLGGKVWQYLSHAAVCLWLCQSENITLSDSGRVCQRAYIHTRMWVQVYVRVLLSHTWWTPAEIEKQFFCFCIRIIWVKTEFLCPIIFIHFVN